jgi:ABC-type methionine transport system permease subunit
MVIVSVWSGLGYATVLLQAAFAGVDESYEEAAKIDGASPTQIFWKITFHAITPTLGYLLTMRLIGALQEMGLYYQFGHGIMGTPMWTDDLYAWNTPVVYLYEMIFNNLSMDFVELALKIIMGTDIWNSGSLYDYYFEDHGNSFTLTGIYFGVGIDMNNLEGASASSIPYAINIYEKKLSLNKSTKKAAWEKHTSRYSDEASLNILKSSPFIVISFFIYHINYTTKFGKSQKIWKSFL